MRTKLAIFIAMCLTGCSVYQPPQRDDNIVIPDSFEQPITATTSIGACHQLLPAEASWLDEAIDSNLELARAAARLRQAEALAATSRSRLWPRLDTQLQYTRTDSPFSSTSTVLAATGISESWQGAVAASYELDLWSQIRNENQANVLQAEAAAAALETIRIAIAAEALDSWAAAVAQQALVAELASQIETSEKFLELTRLRFGLGQAPAQDIGRQKQQLLSLQGQQAQVLAASDLARQRLAILLGQPPRAYESALPTLPAVPALPDPGIPADVIARRPDVRAAVASLNAADRRTAAAIAARLPGVSLTASLLSFERDLGDIFSDAYWSLGSTVAATLFDNGALQARVELQRAAADEAFIDYTEAVLTALHEVHGALVRNASQDQFVASLEAQYDEAQKVLTLTRDAYRQGQVSFLDVLTALTSVQSLERQRIEAQRQQLSNRIELCRAAGIAPGSRNPT
ncbi:MAG: efflux transporter outer membrane subunit [Gammaproteobacteria bacterium]|nr:efflux transporter outer membrane subunit [Gammaproteobacteria bacterium]